MRKVIEKQNFSTSQNAFSVEDGIILDSTFSGCDIEGANFMDAVFVRCQFTTVSLYWGQMYKTLFLDCSFTDVDFRGANLVGCAFVHCTLTRCNFKLDNLGGDTDISEVTFTDTQQIDCKYDAA